MVASQNQNKKNIAVLVGSLRQDSINRRLAEALAALAPSSLGLNIVEIGQMPFYNEDDEAQAPQAWRDFRDQVRGADGVLFVSPEYNRSIPAVLKNAIDVGSRPYGKSVWDGKPTAVVTASPSPIGGFGANHHLRQTMVFLNMPALQMPEAYIGRADTLFDDQGGVKEASTREFLTKFLQAFDGWVAQHPAPTGASS
ncbi:MAG: NAD(P)H-dependent oxidoreductase [Rubrivivax sp.]|nr:MAG: NAD(P)H-dependent oxidoreductase [Rubrivivax sp.]